MKLTVIEKEHNIRLRIPTGLALNRVTGILICKAAQKHGVTLTPRQVGAFLEALHTYRKAHKDWVLVEVNSSNGEYVQIKL